MTGGHGQQPTGIPAAAQRRPQGQGLCHGAASPEHPCKRDPQLPHRIAGSRALRLQVPRQRQLDLLLRHLSFLQAEPCSPQLQVFLRCFPAGLSKTVVLAQLIKAGRQGAFPFFFAPHRRPGRNDRRLAEQQCIAMSCCHGSVPPVSHTFPKGTEPFPPQDEGFSFSFACF